MIKAIMAIDCMGGVGKSGTLPWPANKEDLRHFKNQTDGHIVVMGSKTWDDPCFPAPLKNRKNVVVTSKPLSYYPDADDCIGGDYAPLVQRLDENDERDVWIIGGPTIIKECSHLIQELQLTVIDGDYDCDTFLDFPFEEFEQTLGWKSTTGETNNEYRVYRRKI